MNIVMNGKAENTKKIYEKITVKTLIVKGIIKNYLIIILILTKSTVNLLTL